jgi:hypothetical protein
MKFCFVISEPTGLQEIVLRRLYVYCAFEKVLGALYNTLPYFYQCKTEFLKNIALKKIV